MDLRSLIEKLDTIEQRKQLFESEQLTEKVRIRYADVEAVAKQYATDENARGLALAKLAKENGLPGLFDPVSREFVNLDGSFSTVAGASEAAVQRLEDWGLLPLGAKTSSWLGMRGKDEKTAMTGNLSAQGRDAMVDKAEAFMKKGLETTATPVKESKSLAEQLIAELNGVDLDEAITPEEHKELKKIIADLAPWAKTDPDVTDVTAQFRAYNDRRNDIIEQVKALIARIKSRKATTTTPPTPAPAPKTDAGQAGTKAKPVSEGAATGTVKPKDEESTLQKVDNAMRGAGNVLSFGYADNLEAWINSKINGTPYAEELKKSLTRTTVAKNKAGIKFSVFGHEFEPNAYDLGSVGGAGLAFPRAGLAGTAALIAGDKAVSHYKDKADAAVIAKGDATQQGQGAKAKPTDDATKSGANLPPATKDAIEALQAQILAKDPKALPKYGADGKWGSETASAAKRLGIKVPFATSGAGSVAGATAGNAAGEQSPSGATAVSNLPSDPAVKQLQDALVKAGIQLPKFGADGKFGSETAGAIKEFAKKSGTTDLQAMAKLVGIAEQVNEEFEKFLSLNKKLNETKASWLDPVVSPIERLIGIGTTTIVRVGGRTFERAYPGAKIFIERGTGKQIAEEEVKALAAAAEKAGEKVATNAAADTAKAGEKTAADATADAAKTGEKTAADATADTAKAGEKGGAAGSKEVAAELKTVEKSLAAKFGEKASAALGAVTRAGGKAVALVARYPILATLLAAAALTGWYLVASGALEQTGEQEGEGGHQAGGAGGAGGASDAGQGGAEAKPDPDLDDLTRLMDRLNGGWPDDPQTAEMNALAAEVGYKGGQAGQSGQGGKPAETQLDPLKQSSADYYNTLNQQSTKAIADKAKEQAARLQPK